MREIATSVAPRRSAIAHMEFDFLRLLALGTASVNG